MRVDHDISLLVPEIWCRMRVPEREPTYLIAHGCLEKLADFEMDGRKVLASRLGYRITPAFVDRFLGRIFEVPGAVFPEEMLRPELQGHELFSEGIDAIVEAQKRAALLYFEDGSVEAACPPLKALLEIMGHGASDGRTVTDPSVRELFKRPTLLQSDWYNERLRTKQQRDLTLWRRHLQTLENLGERSGVERSAICREIDRIGHDDYVASLVGTLGADPFHCQMTGLTEGRVLVHGRSS
jgi:hypothetical protein